MLHLRRCDAELAETDEMMSSSLGSEAFFSAGVMKGGSVLDTVGSRLRCAFVAKQAQVKSDPIAAAVSPEETLNIQCTLGFPPIRVGSS